ncbi:uncharacterized protein TNCV_3389331 [Trichonephila clavipes]|nr:uncharacterized protein TNCV_3389331 [Trichonephila clavipes]
MVKVTDRGWRVMSSSLAPLKTRREQGPMNVKYVDAEIISLEISDTVEPEENVGHAEQNRTDARSRQRLLLASHRRQSVQSHTQLNDVFQKLLYFKELKQKFSDITGNSPPCTVRFGARIQILQRITKPYILGVIQALGPLAPTGMVVSDADCGAVGMGSNLGEDRDVCKCIVLLRHGGTLNSRRAASPLVCLVEEKWEASDHPQGFLPLNWGGTEKNRTVTCMVLKAKANDRRKNSSPYPQ